MTIRNALAEGSSIIKTAGIASAALDASLLLAKTLGKSRAALIAAGPEPLSYKSLAAFRGLIARRVNGECTAYILGRKEFRGLDFIVSPAVLVPRPDTETLVEAALEYARNMVKNAAHADNPAKSGPLRILDLCTGSGAVAVSLKNEMPDLEIRASDISEAALEIARANASRLLAGGRSLPGTAVTFLQSDLFDAFKPALPQFSLIVSNPPYVPTAEIKTLSPEVQNEPLLALDGGDDGLAIIKTIISDAPDFLLPGGALLLEADPRQMQSIAALLAEQGFTGIKTYRDLSGRERVISGAKPNRGSP